MKRNNLYLLIGAVIIVVVIASFMLKDRGDIVGKWNLFDASGKVYGTYEFTSDGEVHFDVMGNKMDALYENHGDHLVIKSHNGDVDEINYQMPNPNKIILLGEHPTELIRAK